MKSHRRLPKNLNFVNRKRKKGPLLQSHSTGCSSPALERNSNRTSSSEQRNGFHQNLLSSWLCARILTNKDLEFLFLHGFTLRLDRLLNQNRDFLQSVPLPTSKERKKDYPFGYLKQPHIAYIRKLLRSP